jgi:ceramide glucosyltransferase
VEATGWRAVWLRHLRWARTLRAVRPAGYAGTIVAHGWVPALGLAALGGPLQAAALVGTWALVRIGSVALNARRTGLSARDLCLLPVADGIAMGLYAGGLFARSVRWNGARLRVRAGGSIRPVAAPTPIPRHPACPPPV